MDDGFNVSGDGKLKAYWWRSANGGCNFGDEITSIILNRKFHVAHSISNVDEADLISVGSILNKLVNNKAISLRNRKIHVVGSGLISPYVKHASLFKRMKPMGRTFGKSVVIHSVRGYMTQQVLTSLGEKEYPVGDPGLMLPLIYDTDPDKIYKIGFIPHISTIDNPEWKNVCSRVGNSIIIDFRTDDLESIVTQIKSCDIIVSQSLHGLIIADAYGIPNCWYYDGPLHSGGKFKFYDYFSSVGRSFALRFCSFNELNAGDINRYADKIDPNVICSLQSDIVKSFEKALQQI